MAFSENNDNGQNVSYVKDALNKQLCVVEACKRIRRRVVRLKIQKDKPIVVFSEITKGKKKTSFIDDVIIL